MKRVFVLIMTFTMLLLAGCSAVDAKLEQVLLEKSGILEQEDYLQYQQYQEKGRLDEDGQYFDPDLGVITLSEQEKPSGKIHITFAENRYMNFCYYADSSMKTPIDTTSCYLNPGDRLYAKVKYFNPNSTLYRLAECRIMEYDADGIVKNESIQKVKDGVLEYEIPTNFTGTEMSIIPVGEYPNRKLSMSVYYVDDNGNKCSLGNAGTWSVNNNSVDGNTAQISPIESYILKFTYDTDNYFYVGCEPACFTKNPASVGFVEFWEADSTDADMNYSVELHKFLSLSLEFGAEAKVNINQGDFETIKKNKVWNNTKLQYGDSITIETSGTCTITDGNYQHISATKDPIMDGYRYTLKVVQAAESNAPEVLKQTLDVKRTFNVTLDRNCEYGTCSYKLDGKTVSGTTQVQEGQELTVTYKITDKNYSFADKSEGIERFIHDIFKASERTVSIPVTTDLEGTTIGADDWFDIVKKGE